MKHIYKSTPKRKYVIKQGKIICEIISTNFKVALDKASEILYNTKEKNIVTIVESRQVIWRGTAPSQGQQAINRRNNNVENS